MIINIRLCQFDFKDFQDKEVSVKLLSCKMEKDPIYEDLQNFQVEFLVGGIKPLKMWLFKYSKNGVVNFNNRPLLVLAQMGLFDFVEKENKYQGAFDTDSIKNLLGKEITCLVDIANDNINGQDVSYVWLYPTNPNTKVNEILEQLQEVRFNANYKREQEQYTIKSLRTER